MTPDTRAEGFVAGRKRRLRIGLGVIAGLLIAGAAALGLIDLADRRQDQSRLGTWGLPQDLYDHLGRLEELSLPGTVTRLDWLARAKRLKTLTVEAGLLESLEGLPAGLETLTVGPSRLSDLSGLPPALRSLTLGTSRIRTFAGLSDRLESLDVDLGNEPAPLDTLPRSLRSLRLVLPAGIPVPDLRRLEGLQSLSLLLLGGNESSRLWERLPPRLTSLRLEGRFDAGFDGLPPALRSLAIRGTTVPSLADLPPGIASLEVGAFFAGFSGKTFGLEDGTRVVAPEIDVSPRNELQSLTVELPPTLAAGVRLRRLPTHLVSLKVASGWVALSEPLPQGLRELEIQGRVLGVGRDEQVINAASVAMGYPSSSEPLPKLPGTLKRLKTLRLEGAALPAGLRSLDLSEGDVSELSGLPAGLTELNLRETAVRELPGNLQGLTHLDISFTGIDTLDELPPSLKSLGLGIRQVETLEGLPDGVTALHFHGERRKTRR